MENNKDIYFAPVIIPTLCRSKFFINLVESLKRNTWAKYTDIYVGLDYPPSEKYRQGWQEICDYLDSSDFSVFAHFEVFRRTENLGGFRNNNELTKYVMDRYECMIRVDDDLEFSPNFLEFMDKCLWKYRDDNEVLFVSGYSYPMPWKVEEGATCFRQNFSTPSWGLGLWKKKHPIYTNYIRNGQMLKDAAQFIKEGREELMSLATFRYYFFDVLSLKSKSGLYNLNTDVSLTTYMACKGGYCVTPTLSKVKNFGWDGSGEFCHAITGEFGNHSCDYDYAHQEIDTSESFELIPDDSKRYMKENRELLSEFEYDDHPGPLKRMEVAQHSFALVKRYGRPLALLIHLFEYGWAKITKKNSVDLGSSK